MRIEDELLNKEYWETTYNKMILKQGISKEDKVILWETKEIEKEFIVSQLLSGVYEWSLPEKKLIAKNGKNAKRTVYIYSLKDRYILGVLYRALSNYYYEDMSKSCFSYKTKTNTSDAIKYISKTKTENLTHGVKIDIHAYFNSVSQERVSEMINELFKDWPGLRKTIEKLMLNNTVIWKGKEIEEWKSIIPGCALGSLFANYCLTECDKYFDSLPCVYARYSDDILILDESLEDLQKDLDIVMSYISKYGLEINPDKYTWFEPGEDVEYLGLKLLGNGKIDISNHAKQKIKKQIHRWCRKGRMEIERDYKPFEVVAKRVIRQLNNKNFKCFIRNQATFGWCHYCFRYITTIESLREIDFYTRDTIRAMKTGKHNKANVRAISDEEFTRLGWVSLVDLYMLYKEDFDYYCEIIELL